MDPLTQGVLGAASAQSVSRPGEIRRASVIGFLSGMVADIDVLIRSSSDPMLVLEYHRHFTHSLLFVPFGALLASLVLWPFFRKHLSFRRVYLYSFAGYLFSGFIDTCTSYGTYWLWPLLDERLAWHIISIVDPVFTLGLIIAIVFAFKKRQALFGRVGLVFAACYLLLGVVQLQRAESVLADVVAERGHVIEQQMVKPTLGNLVLWRSTYLAGDTFYIDAIRVGIEPRFYEGDSIPRFNEDSLPASVGPDTRLFRDIERFRLFSDGYVAYYPGRDNVLGDIRYSMSPLSSLPLWGIELDFSRPDEHVRYDFYRQVSKQHRQEFVDMLFGREL
ncbi:MAG: metal-dependent hydrolase [Gammaproteobacteria bacterium]